MYIYRPNFTESSGHIQEPSHVTDKMATTARRVLQIKPGVSPSGCLLRSSHIREYQQQQYTE